MEAQRAGRPLRVGDVTLLPVERAVIRSGAGDAGCWLGALKAPVAVVVCDAGGVRALGPDSAALALDALVAETPGLADVLAGI